MKDEELVMKIQKLGDEESIELLLFRYRALIFSIINQFKLITSDYMIDKDDLFQEGSIALYQAAVTYKDNMNTCFVTYAYTIIKRRIIKYIKKASKVYMSEGVSMDYTINQEACTSFASDRLDDNPKRSYLYKELIKKSYDIFNNLSEDEKNIIRLRRESMTYEEISKALDINIKSVDYKLQKIRKKIKEYELLNNSYIKIERS